jgi:integrase/recombinase XerD
MKVSVVLKDKTKKRSLVLIRLSHEGERRYISLGSIDVVDWDPVKCRSKKRDASGLILNASIERRVNEIQRKILRLQTLNIMVTMDRILEKEIKANKFSEYFEQIIAEYEQKGKIYSVRIFKAVLKRIKTRDVNISMIDEKWIAGFMEQMREDGLSNTSQHNYIRICKIVINRCIRYNIIHKSPFADVRTKKDAVFKSKLDVQELQKLQDVPNKTYYQQLAIDTFMLAFYMYGSRCLDVITLRKSQIKDGRILLVQSKTGKIHNIKVTEDIKAIMNRYNTHTYVLPWFDDRIFQDKKQMANYGSSVNYRINRQLSELAKLAGIEKKVTMHVARHSFATLANRSNLRITDIQKLLNHQSLSVTQTYLNELGIDEHLDNEAAKVFDAM